MAAGEHFINGHQDSRDTKEKVLVITCFGNMYYIDGKIYPHFDLFF